MLNARDTMASFAFRRARRNPDGPVVAKASSRCYHRPCCKLITGRRGKDGKVVTFEGADAAERAGYVGCKRCVQASKRRTTGVLPRLAKAHRLPPPIRSLAPHPDERGLPGLKGKNIKSRSAELLYYRRDLIEEKYRWKMRGGRRLRSEWRETVWLRRWHLAEYLELDPETVRGLVREATEPGALALPQPKPDIPGLEDSVGPSTFRRREQIEGIIAQTEREAADALAKESDNGFLYPHELGGAFGIRDLEGLCTRNALGIPMCTNLNGEPGYRPGHVCEWLAARREEQREKEEALLSHVAVVYGDEAGWVLGVSTATAKAWAKDVKSPLVSFRLPGTAARHSAKGDRGDRDDRTHYFRLKSIRVALKMAVVRVPDVEVPEAHMHLALGGQSVLAACVLRGAQVLGRKMRTLTKEQQELESKPGDDRWWFKVKMPDGKLERRPGVSEKGPTQGERRRQQAEEWDKLRERLGAWPSVGADGTVRLRDLDKWLDRLEAVALGEAVEAPIRLLLDGTGYEVIAGTLDGDPIVFRDRIAYAQRMLAFLHSKGRRASKKAVTETLGLRWSRGKVELKKLLGKDGAKRALGEDKSHLWLTDEVSVEIKS